MRAWLDNLDRLHAERDLRFADLSQASLETIYDLKLLACGDEQESRRFKLLAYGRRLEEKPVPGED